MPGRLNRFQLALIRLLWITRESFKLRNPLVHVGKAHCVRIKVREFIRQPDSNIFQVVPIKRRRHFARSPKTLASESERLQNLVRAPTPASSYLIAAILSLLPSVPV